MLRVYKTAIILFTLSVAALMVAIPVYRKQKEPSEKHLNELPNDVVASSENGASDGERNTFGIYNAGSLGSVTPSSRQIMMETLGVDSYGAFQDFNIQAMREAGVEWIRVDFEYDGIGFKDPSDHLERLRNSGLEVVGCARPTIRSFLSSDMPSFQNSLRRLVERYPWIKTWQVGNEPNIAITNPEANLALANPDDYARLFLAGSRAIREACPECRTMLAGVAANEPSMEQAQEYYRRVLTHISAQSRGQRPFDIFDLHFYGPAGDDGLLLAGIQDYRRMLRETGLEQTGAEIWMTETATHTAILEGRNAAVQTEEDQAAELVRRFVTALGSGLARVSWARPYENYRYSGLSEDNFFDNAGLIYNGLGQEAARGIRAGTKKKSWYAYRTLASKVKGYHEIRHYAPGVYEFDFGPQRKPMVIVWDMGTGMNPDRMLPVSARGRAKVTDITGGELQTDTSYLLPNPNPVFVEPSGT